MSNTKNPAGKRFRFNFIDVGLILIILLSAGALWYLLTRYGQPESTEQTQVLGQIEYRLTVSPLREEFRGKVNVGDKVWDRESGQMLGEVTDVSYGTYPFVGTNASTGENVTSNYPGLLTMTVKVRSDADMTDGFCRIGQEEMLIGKEIGFRVPGLYADGVCSTLEILDGQ